MNTEMIVAMLNVQYVMCNIHVATRTLYNEAHDIMIKYIRNTKKQNTCKTYI